MKTSLASLVWSPIKFHENKYAMKRRTRKHQLTKSFIYLVKFNTYNYFANHSTFKKGTLPPTPKFSHANETNCGKGAN